MARKSTPAPQSQPANLTAAQIRDAIPILERRISELEAVDVDQLQEETGDQILDDLVRKIDDSLIRVFGRNTIEYDRYCIESLSAHARLIIYAGQDDSIGARRKYIKIAVGNAISKLQSAVDILKEHLEDSGDTVSGRAIRAYEGLELHPEIARAASKRFRDGHYSDAVEAAVKALNGLVRLRSGLELDGAKLMQKAFSPNAPILAFNALASPSDQDEQRGYMMLFDGAVAGLRNPRAHGFVQDRPERALEFIAFVSLLAKLLDDATNT